jgi:hypothetical protein
MFDSVISGAIRAGKELFQLGLDTKRQEDAFARMTASLGVNGAALEQALETASRGIADVSDVMTTAAQALQEGLKPGDLVKLMEIATQQSKLMGTTVVESFNSITTAILRQQERGLKTAGIYVDLNTVFDEHARKLGTTTDRLTDLTKTQALMAAAADKARASVKALDDGLLTQPQQVEKARTAWVNFTETLGKNLVDLGFGIVQWAQQAAGAIDFFAKRLAGIRASIEDFFTSRQDTLIGGLVTPWIAAGQATRAAQEPLDKAKQSIADLGNNSAVAGPKIRDTAASIKAAADAAKKAAEDLSGFRQKLVEMSVVDATAKQLMGVRAEVEKLSKAAPQNAGELKSIGAAMEAVIIQVTKTKEELKVEEALLKENTEGWIKHAEAVFDATEQEQKAEVEIRKSGKALQEQAEAQVAAGWVAHAEAVIAATEADQNAEVQIRKTRAALFNYEEALKLVKVQASILGSDFDVMGAKTAIARQAWEQALASYDKGHITLDQLSESGRRFQAALGDERFYKSIENALLSITDTITKMTTAWIQGTLTWKSAGETLLGFLLNFGQSILHDVFDPILKGLARVASAWISSFLFGGGGGTGGALASLGGSALGGLFGGGGNISAEQFSAIGLGAAGGGSGGSTLGTLGSAASGLSTLYSVVQQLGQSTGLLELPTLMGLASEGIIALGEAVGLITPVLEAASIAGALLPEAGTAALTGLELISALGPEVADGVISGLAGAIGPGGLVLAPLSIGMLAQTLFGRSREDARWERYQQARQAQAMTADVGGGLQGLTLANALEAPRRKFLETLKAFAEFSAIIPEQLEMQRQAGTLQVQNIPGGQYTAGGQPPPISEVLPFEQSPVLKEAKSLVDSLTKLGIDASHRWAQTSKELGSTTLFQNFDQWNRLVVAYAKALEGMMGKAGGGDVTEDASVALERLRIESLITAESLNTIADVLGVATQAVPDFSTALADEIPAMVKTLKSNLVDSFLAEPIKIAGLLDLKSLQKEGEDVKATFQRMATALQGLGGMMVRLTVESEQLRGTLDIPARFAQAMVKITKAISDAQGTLAGARDPEQMLAAAQQLEALIKERYRIETEAVTTLIERYREYAALIVASVSALANAGDTLAQLGVSIQGMTSAAAQFVMGMDDAQAQLAAFPALLASAMAEAGQIMRAGGSVNAGLDVLLASPVDALRDTFEEVMAILDPSARAAALQGFLGQIDSFFQSAVSGIKSYYATARSEAERLAEEWIKGIREAAAEQIKPLEAMKEQAQAGLEALAEQREVTQEYIDGIREALSVRVDALNEEKDGLQEILKTAQDASRAAKSLRDALADIYRGELAPPNAQAQFDAALDAFNAAKPEEAGGAARDLLDTALRTGLMTRPDPEYRELFQEVTARLEAMAVSAEALASPEEQSLARLKSIDAEIKALNAEAKAALAPLEASLKSIDAQSKDLNKSVALIDKSIAGINAEADKQVKEVNAALKEHLTKLSVDEKAAIDRVKDALAPLAEQTVAALYSTTVTVGSMATLAQQQLGVMLNSLSYDAWIANRTEAMASDLANLSGSIRDSLRDLVASRLDALLQTPGGAEGIRAALDPSLGKIISNTFATGYNTAELVRGAFRGTIGTVMPAFPSAQFGLHDTGEGGLVLTHPHERVLTSAEKREYESGGGGGGGGTFTLTVNVDARGAADPQTTAAAVRREIEKLWDGMLRAKIQDLRRRS